MGPVGHSLAALAAAVGAPVVATSLVLNPAWRHGLGQRFGLLPRVGPVDVWVHGASVGEALAVSHLAGSLGNSGRSVFVSSITDTGQAVLASRLPSVSRGFAPLDHPWCVHSALKRVRPRVLALVETELWPMWIRAASEANVAVVIASGRLSDRSYPRYLRWKRLLASTMTTLAAVGARSETDAERFAELGVPLDRIRVTGDLKLELPAGSDSQEAPAWTRCLADLPVFVAGSTHEGEERPALQAVETCRAAGLRVSLVLAPRHLERVGAVCALIERAGWRVRRRSHCGEDPLADDEVLVLDTLGELTAVYAVADVAFVGGTLVDVGGHNLIEPVFSGCPVLFGPRTQNVREAAALLEELGAGLRVADADALGSALRAWLADPGATRARGDRGRHELAQHRGSAERCVELIEGFVLAAGTNAVEAR